MNNLAILKKITSNKSVDEVFELSLNDKKLSNLAKANLAYVIGTNPAKFEMCDPISIASSIVQMTNLGFSAQTGESYIIPYKTQATYQIGYKGWISLALRSKEIKSINADLVYEGELVGENRLSGEFEWRWIFPRPIHKSVIGYFGFIKLSNGFSKTIFWTKEQMHQHFSKFSGNNYDSNKKIWLGDYNFKTQIREESKIINVDDKAKITMIKQIISKFAPKNPTIDHALKIDSSTFNSQGQIDDFKNKREPIDKNLIRNVLNQVSKIIKKHNLAQSQSEASKVNNNWAIAAGIDFAISNGWYGITTNELISFANVIFKETGERIIVDGKNILNEKMDEEKDYEINL